MKISGSASEFVRAGIPARNWFRHHVVTVAKQYPDTFLYLSRRSLPAVVPGTSCFRQINLYADDLDGLPDALFTDRSVNWHQQQFGRKGHVASAGLYLYSRDEVFVLWLQSDLCQQLFRHAELRAQCRTQVDSRFGRWYQVLLNAVLDFCLDRELRTLYLPTAETVLRLCARPVQPHLFRRVYDDASRRLRCERRLVGGTEHWEIPVAANLERIARLRAGESLDTALPGRVCIFHDIEEDVDTDVSKEDCKRWFREMLRIEREACVPATYSVLGSLYKEKFPHLMEHGVRSLAFHSCDHKPENGSQLARVRKIDHQVRGYRPPRSVITPETGDRALSYYNFEWLLSSAGSLHASRVFLENGLVKIPVHIDDYPLHTGRLTPAQWNDRLAGLLDQLPLVVIGLHDCYARHWIASYGDFLEGLRRAGGFVTCDQIADAAFLATDAAPLEPWRGE